VGRIKNKCGPRAALSPSIGLLKSGWLQPTKAKGATSKPVPIQQQSLLQALAPTAFFAFAAIRLTILTK
jgi:hypothetical protein